jgi:hypothetical protein
MNGRLLIKRVKTITPFMERRGRNLLLSSIYAAIFIFSESLSGQRMERYPVTPEEAVSRYDEITGFTARKPDNRMNKTEPGFSLILDSIYEQSNLGYKQELIKWYHSYNQWYQKDTVMKFFFNDTGEFQDIIEIQSFYSDGSLKRLVRRQPNFDPYYYPFSEDTGVIDYYIEEYSYANGLLSRKLSISNEYYEPDTTLECYFYDPEGKLISDSIKYGNGSYYRKSEYRYNSDNALEYIIRYSSGSQWFTKYTYETGDASSLVTEYYGWCWECPEEILIDTIAHWNDITYYDETFDTEGRRATLTVSVWSLGVPQMTGNTSRAEYSYTDAGDPAYSVYYRWVKNTAGDGEWKESTRIEYTYDEEGNILLYDKTFFDDRTEAWENDNRKEYFYTPVSNELATEESWQGDLCLYPNPVVERLILGREMNSVSCYTINDLCGIKVAEGRLTGSSIDVSGLKAGIYILMLDDRLVRYTGKFIKI